MSQPRNEGGLTHNNLEGTSRSTSIDPQTEGAENRGSTSTTQSTDYTPTGGRSNDEGSRSNVSNQREESGTSENDYEETMDEDLEDDEDAEEEE